MACLTIGSRDSDEHLPVTLPYRNKALIRLDKKTAIPAFPAKVWPGFYAFLMAHYFVVFAARNGGGFDGLLFLFPFDRNKG